VEVAYRGPLFLQEGLLRVADPNSLLLAALALNAVDTGAINTFVNTSLAGARCQRNFDVSSSSTKTPTPPIQVHIKQ